MTIRQHFRRGRGYLASEGLGPFLVKSVAGSGAVRIAGMLATFAVGVQLARGLGVEGYGYYGIAVSVITIAGIPAELGLPRLITREVAAARARKDFPYILGVLQWGDRVALRISAVVALIIVASALALAALRPSAIVLSLLLGAPVIPLMALSRIRGGALQGLDHVARGQIPAGLLRPTLISLLLFLLPALGFSLGVPAILALYSLTAGAVLLVAHMWLKQRLPKGVPAEVVKGGRRWIASSIPMALTEGMRTLQAELSILLIGMIANPAAVGLFRIANVTALMATIPMQVILRVALPVIARLYAGGDHVRLQKVVTALARVQLCGVLILSLPLLVFPGPLLSFAFGSSYAPAADALRILTVGQIVNAAFGPNAVLLNMTHLERRVTRAMAFALSLTALTVPLLAMRWGAAGAALGLVGSLWCWNIIAWRDAWRLRGIETSAFGSIFRSI